MAKRRTKKQKSKAKHQFLLNWKPDSISSSNEAKNAQVEAVVKGQIKNRVSPGRQREAKLKIADFQAKKEGLVLIRRDIIKSLFLASLILALEVVLYLAWK